MSRQLEPLRAFLAGRPAPRGRPGPTAMVVAGGKGGVGTSTVAALLALAAAQAGSRVLLVDGDGQAGALPALLGVTGGWPLDALRGGAVTPDELLIELAPTLALLPGPLPGTDISAAERRALGRRALGLRDRYDLTIVDAGARLDAVLDACDDGATQLVAVTSGDRIALAAAYALCKAVLTRHPAAAVGALTNRVPDADATIAFDHLDLAAERFLGRRLPRAGVMPDDATLGAGTGAGMRLQDAAAGGPALSAASDIVRRLLASAPVTAPAVALS